MKSFLISLTALTAIIALIIVGVNEYSLYHLTNWAWYALAFFFGLTILVFSITRLGFGKNQALFIRSFYSGMFLRFFLGIGFLVIYLLFNELHSKPFIVFYILIYLLYTMFEIYQIVTNLRAEKKRNSVESKH